MTRPPIVGAALWTAVMKKAGDRCECRGACGKKHDPERKRKQGRCPLTNGHHVSKRGEIILVAMPRDPITHADFVSAASLPPSRLAAMCPECHDAVRAKIRRAAMCPECHDAVRAKIRRAEKALEPQVDDLFAVDEYRVSKSAGKQADVGAA